MKKFLSALLLIILLSNLYSQNLIKNYDFEEGDFYEGCVFAPGDIQNANDFESHVSYWYSARLHTCLFPTVFDCTPSVDLFDYRQCPTYIPQPIESNRCVRMISDGENYREGVRGTLETQLVPGLTYELRLKVSVLTNVPSTIKVYFSKNGDKWHKNTNNNQLLEAMAFNINTDYSYSAYTWYEIVGSFYVPENYDQLNYIEIVGEFPCNIIIDDVFLTKYCKEELLIENYLHYTPEPVYEAKIIKAGYDVGDPDPNGDVIVKSTSDIIYKAEQYIDLEPGFETEDGAEFLAYIAPCGYMCDPLPVPLAGEDVELCNNNPITIGLNQSIPNDVQCYWTASPSSMLQHLDNSNSLNPVFTPPSGCGEVVFTLHFTNECAYMASDEITISYNTENTSNNSIGISNVEMDNFEISFDVTTSSCTDEMTIEILSEFDNYTNPVYQHTYIAGIDYYNGMHWSSAGYVYTPCWDYKIRVSTTGICISSEIETFIDWPRNEEIELIDYNNIITLDGNNVNECLEFLTSGAEWYHVQVFNPETGTPIYDQLGPILTQPLVTWCPGGNTTQIPYYWVAEFTNTCNHTEYYNGTVTVYGSSGNNKAPETDEQVIAAVIQNPKIYPNPAADQLFIDFGSYELTKVEIIDVLGRVFIIKQLNEESIQSVFINELPEGFYFAKLYSRSGDFFTYKFLKSE